MIVKGAFGKEYKGSLPRRIFSKSPYIKKNYNPREAVKTRRKIVAVKFVKGNVSNISYFIKTGQDLKTQFFVLY